MSNFNDMLKTWVDDLRIKVDIDLDNKQHEEIEKAIQLMFEHYSQIDASVLRLKTIIALDFCDRINHILDKGRQK